MYLLVKTNSVFVFYYRLQSVKELEGVRLHVGLPLGFFTYPQKCQLWHFCLSYMKTKKSSNKMLPPVGIEPRPQDSMSNMLLAEPLRQLLVRLRL